MVTALDTSTGSTVEKLLLELQERSWDDLGDKWSEFLEAVCQFSGVSGSDAPAVALFDQGNTDVQKRRIAVCLLRSVCYNPDAVWKLDPSFSLKAFNLFDELFADLYGDLKIDTDTPNHIKLAKLRDLEQKVLSDFETITRTIRTLESACGVREKLMQELNRRLAKLFLDQFVDSALVDRERIRELFRAVEDYARGPVGDILRSYQRCGSVFEEFIAEAETSDSIFCRHCLLQPITKIYEVIRSDFDSREVGKPTEVFIHHVDRKYPFHLDNKPIEVKFGLKNRGPGCAFNVRVSIKEIDGDLEVVVREKELGTFEPGEEAVVKFEGTVQKTITGNSCLMVQVTWSNFGGDETKSKEDCVELCCQRVDMDWDVLRLKKPYSLEAIENEEELVGRQEIIQTLYSKLRSHRVESSIIYGQKRVGKTSIVRTIESKLQKEPGYTIVYIGLGELNKNDLERFINSLGQRIAAKVTRELKKLPAFADVPLPNPAFAGSLDPLIDFFESVKEVVPGQRIVIVLDEFDEMPTELYKFSKYGDTFFHNIRSLSEGHSGFVLVGGENMQIILQTTHRLNKFETFPVDYFDRRYWNDFEELVRRPGKDALEFSAESIERLYAITEGNPFFAKLICAKIYSQACEARSSYVSVDEVDEAIRSSIESLNANLVNHFWTDGISEDELARRDNTETQRRKILIAYADMRRSGKPVTKQALRDHELLHHRVAVDAMVESFVNRRVLVEESGCLRIKPRFFDKALCERVSHIITTGLIDEMAAVELAAKEDKAFVRDSEIEDLCKQWPAYRSREIQSLRVRAWLDQFGDNLDRRLMFKLLQRLRFYGEVKIREKFQALHNRIRSNVEYEWKVAAKKLETKRWDFLLSSFGAPSKSGSSFARLYAQENNVSVQNVVRFDEIAKSVRNNDRIQMVVFVEDLIGTGAQTSGWLKDLNAECGELLGERGIKVIICAICGVSSGISDLKNVAKGIEFDVKVEVSDELTEPDRAFSDHGKCFELPEDRERARQIALDLGRRLDKSQPLGYNDSELLVVFHDNCPNNSLPILWKVSARDPKWVPLFERM